MANYELTKLAANILCPGNVVQTDDAGLPSVLVYIPKFKNSDVLAGGDDSTHPAFIVNGKEIPGFYYSKYQNVVHNGAAYSLAGEDPHSGLHFDNALAHCEAKGPGWHLSTAAEWAAIALWCKKNGFLPYGNNQNGKDSRESNVRAVPSTNDKDGNIEKVKTGTGPITWSHDGTPSGVWDMNGNLFEWQGGIRIVWGELQILPNNDAADTDNPQNSTSTCWKAINAADGSLVEPESKTTDASGHTSGNTVKLDYVNSTWTYSAAITNANDSPTLNSFIKLNCDNTISDAAKVLLRALALLPDEGEAYDYGADYAYWNNGRAEMHVIRGGHWFMKAGGGIFSIYGASARNNAGLTNGFRAAYIPEIGQ